MTAVRSFLTGPGGLALGGLVLLAVGGAVIQGKVPATSAVPPNALTRAATFRYPPAEPTIGPPAVMADSDRRLRNEPLWTVRARRGGGLLVSRLAVGDKRREGATSWRLPSVERGLVAFDVVRWDGAHEALFEFTVAGAGRGRRAVVRVVSIGAHPRVLARGAAPLGALPPGVHLDLAAATWSGTRPDLLVVERGLVRSQVNVRIFSGESGFRKLVFSHVTPVTYAPSKSALVEFGRVDGTRPELHFLIRDGIYNAPETHTVSGESAFMDFMAERPLDLPVTHAPQIHIVAGGWRGYPAFYRVSAPATGPVVVTVLPFVRHNFVIR
jgi:hypothetical protein